MRKITFMKEKKTGHEGRITKIVTCVRVSVCVCQVNLVEDDNRLVLVVDASPERLKNNRDELAAVLQDHSRT